jgi:hypothetical protein
MPAEIREEINMLIYNAATAPVIEMKAYYNDISGGYRNVRDLYNIADDEYAEEDDGIPSVNVAKENYTNDKARIENMIRMITRDISDEDRGAIIKLIAGITKNNTEKETESRIALSLCNPEYLLFLVKCGLNEMDFAGYELLGNNKYKIGDTVYFRNGQAAHAIIKCDKYPYTGWLEIKEFNGRLYGAIDLKSLISVPKITNQIIIKVKQSFVDKYGADAVAKALGRATDVTIHAETGDYTMELVCSDKARSIPYDLAPNNKSYALQRMFAGLTGKVVKVTNNIIDMKTGRGNAVYVSIDLDTIPGMPAIESKAAVSVEDFEEEESMF